MAEQVRIGTVTGTGAAITVSLGWIPDYVKVVNVTDGDITDEWFTGMTASTAISTAAAVAPRSSNGISTFAGSSAAAPGFTLGTGISESGKTLSYIAIRND